MKNGLVLIAETDENGDVVCVWRKSTIERFARPVRAFSPVDEVEAISAEVHGASRSAILSWLARGEIRAAVD